LRVRAFAKINVSLRVLGVRPDGYHELRTVFQSIALHDTLAVRRARGPLRLTCDDPGCPADRSNLVWRAAEAVWAASGKKGQPRGIRLHLAKQIPMQAGLGGGSSDAAAAIRALGRLWNVQAPELCAIGRTLGADIPFFFEGGTVLGLDRGDLLFPLLDPPPSWVVLALPSFGVSTAEAFGWFDQAGAVQPRAGRETQFVNDLQAAVQRRHPEIRALVGALKGAGAAHAAMSGSGSAVFGLFKRRREASVAALAVRRTASRVLLTRTIDRRSYQRLACK
jgi:4-diphosphocytidyl-2-C-methyl-D-erythritol kinase